MTYRWYTAVLTMLTIVGISHKTQAQMSAESELKTLRVPEGMEVSLFASEPLITNPSAIDVDTHGRVWVAEIQWYRSNAKQPPADKIKVLEDTDGDGRADKVTVFAEGVFAPMSICVAGEKVFVATSPDLWLYEDKDGDLRADGPPRKLLTGFGGFNHDHGAHSLVLGPDHKWWMSHGDTGFDVTGTDGSRIKYRWGAMLRGELDGSKLETIAVNFRNPYELCVSSFGECFFSDNDNDGNESVRVGWVMDGGDYGWFGGPPGPKGCVPSEVPFSEHWHFRGHIPGFIPATLVTGFGSPCGICFYEGDAFGPKYKNAPLHCDAGPREVRMYRHELTGYGMKARSENILTTAGDNYFRPDDICTAPDGSLYVSDWYDGGVGGHAYNDPERGRIFRLTPKNKKLQREGKPGPYTNRGDAIDSLRSPNLATQYLAREWILADGERSVPALERIQWVDADRNLRARALWLLDRIGGSGRALVRENLRNQEAAFRALAVRILRRHTDEDVKEILSVADDPSAEVRREVLLAIPSIARVDADAAFVALAKLAESYDGADRYQLEAIHIAAGPRGAELLAHLGKDRWSIEKLPLLMVLSPNAAGEFVTARLETSEDEAEIRALLDVAVLAQAPEAGRGVLKLAANDKAPAELRLLALQTLDVGLVAGWKPLTGDAQLITTLRALMAKEAMRRLVLDIAGKHAITPLGPDVWKLAKSRELPGADRSRAIAIAARLKPSGYSSLLAGLLADEDRAVRQAALAALVDMQDMKTLKPVLSGNGYSAEVRSQTVERLMSATGGALVLLRMLDAKSLSSELEKETVIRAINHPDANVRILFEKFIPVGERPKRLGEAINAEEILSLQGNAKRGEQIFFQSSAAQCKNCHMVRGQGSSVGPDLSLIGKKYERATLLETILDPSKAIAPEFVTYVAETKSGQVFAGFLVEQSEKQVVLKDSKGELVRIPANGIAELLKTEKSVMPELVLRDVTAQDAADLLAYLTSLTDKAGGE